MMHRNILQGTRFPQIIHTLYPLKQWIVDNSVENVDNFALNGLHFLYAAGVIGFITENGK